MLKKSGIKQKNGLKIDKNNSMNDFWYPLFLFPAIPLMMINFGNRYASLSALIRKIHDEMMSENSKAKYDNRYIDELKILNQRMFLVRMMQTLSAISFICNLMTIMFGYLKYENIAVIFFGLAVAIFTLAIITFIFEIQLSVKALKKHLEDLKDI